MRRPTSAAASRLRARSKRWKSTTTRSRMPAIAPWPSARSLAQSTAASSTRPISSASLSRARASGRICSRPNSDRRAGRDGEVDRELDLDRCPHASAALLHHGVEDLRQREQAVLEDRSEGHHAQARAGQTVVQRVVLARVGRADRRQRAVRLRHLEAVPGLAHPARVARTVQRQRPEAALGRVEQRLEGRVLGPELRIARRETDAGSPFHDRAAETERRGGDAVLGEHRERGVEVVRAGDAREVGIEARSARRPDQPLNDHRHPLLLQPVGGGPQIGLGVPVEGRGVDPPDGDRHRARPLGDARRAVGEHQRVVDAGERQVMRVLEQATRSAPRAALAPVRRTPRGRAPPPRGTAPRRSAGRSPRRPRTRSRSGAGRCRRGSGRRRRSRAPPPAGTRISTPGNRRRSPRSASRRRTNASPRALPPSEPPPMR